MSTLRGCTVHVDSDGIARVRLNSSSVPAGFFAAEEAETEGNTTFESEQQLRMLAAHNEGRCKPCAFLGKAYHQAAGCAFCHFCTPEDFKKRRKAAYSRLKAEAKADGTWRERKAQKAQKCGGKLRA
eukprot:TRINITY_DN4283_c0_g3_i1.p1 TRINITY_DN4283_c0_g3~~TRINITY_DN4283_c0_g3_i1.p1  ORF type:complete len:140 (-),score=27.26 TRINITY_DN4283_c0_g3_i1:77-457(-)